MNAIANLESLDDQYSKQVSQQLQRATAELNQLEQLLKAGLVDRETLTDFRESVNRVRTTGWAVQKAIESPSSREDVALLLMMERVRSASQLNTQLALDLKQVKQKGSVDEAPLQALGKTLDRLSEVLEEALNADILNL